jgi:two-component system cell cycle sensor histidine kinase/response regulator CckA
LKGPEYEELLRNHPNIQVVTDLEEPPMNIMGSPVHLMKAIMNLIVNAAGEAVRVELDR